MRRMHSENQEQEIVKSTKKDIATLIDARGHERFIEANLDVVEISGVTYTYGKWSLSGTHLMIVLAGNVANGTATESGVKATATLPEWIFNKIFSVFGPNIERKDISYWSSGVVSQSGYAYLQKLTANKLGIYLTGVTFTDDRAFRLSFDLLIDNE